MRAEASRLEELRLVASERRLRRLVELGRLDEAISGLEAFVVDHPLRERALGALMEALTILLVACFAPFILLKLLIGAEAIVAGVVERLPKSDRETLSRWLAAELRPWAAANLDSDPAPPIVPRL